MDDELHLQSDIPEDLKRRIHTSIDYFFDHIPAELRAKLDYSLASLPYFEEWSLARYPHWELFISDEEDELVDGAVFYVGETTRQTVGGEWVLNLDVPLNAFGHQSARFLITGFHETGFSDPYEEVRYAIDLHFSDWPQMLQQFLKNWIGSKDRE